MIQSILVANYHLKDLGGSETFTYTLAKELSHRGYSVDVFSLHPGSISERIQAFANVVEEHQLKGHYDLALVSHTPIVERLVGRTEILIQTCHGIYPDLEQPSPLADFHVSISEEVKRHVNALGHESTIIWNGIDCDRFSPIVPIRPTLHRVLSLSQRDQANEVIDSACRLLGIEFDYLNKHKNGIWNIEERINQADVVVSLGRGAFEAMACGRSVLVYDNRVYAPGAFGDGLITRKNLLESLKHNLSGRRFQIGFTTDSLAKELQSYDPAQGPWNRTFAFHHLNIGKAVDEYLTLATKYCLRASILKKVTSTFLLDPEFDNRTSTTLNALVKPDPSDKAPLPETSHTLSYILNKPARLKRLRVIKSVYPLRQRPRTEWRNDVNVQSLDLNSEPRITFTAKKVGLKRIDHIIVLPTEFTKDVHYRFHISPDRRSATIEFLTKVPPVGGEVILIPKQRWPF